MIELIYDRTKNDVINLRNLIARIQNGTATEEEKQQYMQPHKGAYNYTDLNRVGTAMNQLIELFREKGYIIHITPKTNWQMTDVPTREAFTEYLENVRALRDVISLPIGTPEVPNIDGFNFQSANDIELILKTVEETVQHVSYFYSGELYSGEC